MHSSFSQCHAALLLRCPSPWNAPPARVTPVLASLSRQQQPQQHSFSTAGSGRGSEHARGAHGAALLSRVGVDLKAPQVAQAAKNLRRKTPPRRSFLHLSGHIDSLSRATGLIPGLKAAPKRLPLTRGRAVVVGAHSGLQGSAAEAPWSSDSEQYYATCHPGLEEVVAAELAAPEIGARSIRPGKAGVYFW